MQIVRSSLGLSVLLRDTSTLSLEELGIRIATFRLQDNCSTSWARSTPELSFWKAFKLHQLMRYPWITWSAWSQSSTVLLEFNLSTYIYNWCVSGNGASAWWLLAAHYGFWAGLGFIGTYTLAQLAHCQKWLCTMRQSCRRAYLYFIFWKRKMPFEHHKHDMILDVIHIMFKSPITVDNIKYFVN